MNSEALSIDIDIKRQMAFLNRSMLHKIAALGSKGTTWLRWFGFAFLIGGLLGASGSKVAAMPFGPVGSAFEELNLKYAPKGVTKDICARYLARHFSAQHRRHQVLVHGRYAEFHRVLHMPLGAEIGLGCQLRFRDSSVSLFTKLHAETKVALRRNTLCRRIPSIGYPDVTNPDSSYLVVQEMRSNETRIGPDLNFADISGHGNGFLRSYDGPSRFNKSFADQIYAERSNNDSRARHKQHPKSPLRHILLSVQVLAGIGLFLGGLYGIYHTFARSGSIHPDTGLKFILLYTVVMLAGCYIIASGVYP